MDHSWRKYAKDSRCAHADAMQCSTEETSACRVHLGLRIPDDHDSVRVQQWLLDKHCYGQL